MIFYLVLPIMCKKSSSNLITQTLLSPIVRGQKLGMISQSPLAQNLSQGHNLSIDKSYHYFEAQWEGSFSKFMQVLDLVPCDLWGEEAPSILSHPSHEATGFHHVDKCEIKEGWARWKPESSVTTSQMICPSYLSHSVWWMQVARAAHTQGEYVT